MLRWSWFGMHFAAAKAGIDDDNVKINMVARRA